LVRALRIASRHVVERLDRTGDRLVRGMDHRLERSRALLTAHSARLDALSPLRVLGRGYAVARDENGRVLKRVAQLPGGKEFRLRVSDGEVNGRVQ
jgi:exodeoxyribonuclease VII large subunit